VVLWNQACISNGFRDIQVSSLECYAMVDMTLVRPLNKGQGNSFCYQLISHIRLPIYAVNSNFCSRTHRLATIHYVRRDDDRQTQHCSISG